MSTLTLQLLGGLHARLGDEPLAGRAGQRKRLALLALLAAAPTRAMSRDRIVAMLWPEHESSRARHQLAAATHDLRGASMASLFLVNGDEMRLNPECADCDLWRFDCALSAGDSHRAIEQYGGPLLDGFHLAGVPEFQRWAEVERDRQARRYAAALECAAAHAMGHGDPQAAVEWLKRRAALDPYDSRVAIGLMRALAAAGNAPAAIQRALEHSALVREEFDTEPDPEINRIADALRASAPARQAAAGNERAAPASTAPPPPGDVSASISRSPGDLVPARRPPRPHLAIASTAIVAVVALGLWHSHGLPAAVVRHPIDRRTAEIYARGRIAWNERTEAGLDSAVMLYRAASNRDPLYAAPFAGLAQSYVMLAYFGFAPADAAFPKAKAAALHALELDSLSGDAYAALGQVLAWEHRWTEAETASLRGIRADPDNPTTHQWYGLLLASLGRPREAAAQTGIASRLDPLSLQINNMYGTMLYHAGDLDGALRQFERTVNAEPDSAWVQRNPWILSNYGAAAAAAGHHAQAVALIERALRVAPGHPRLLLALAGAYISDGKSDSARLVFAAVDTMMPQIWVYRGLLHARLGEFDASFASFDRVREWPIAVLVGLNSAPEYAALRADPRYRRILSGLGMPNR